MSAKTFAFATGCRLLGIDTFAAICRQAPATARLVDVVADGQQDKLYAQRFERVADDVWKATAPLAIVPFAAWAAALTAETCVTGPGLEGRLARLPQGTCIVPAEDWHPRAESLLAVGLARWQTVERDDPFTLEPLYLRASSAEEKMR
jgi:tRNA A37 threonylcarbamoyladenosine modification protein TsaB